MAPVGHWVECKPQARLSWGLKHLAPSGFSVGRVSVPTPSPLRLHTGWLLSPGPPNPLPPCPLHQSVLSWLTPLLGLWGPELPLPCRQRPGMQPLPVTPRHAVTTGASSRLLSGPPKLSGALGKAPRAEPAGEKAPEGVGRDPIIPTPEDPSPRSPVCAPPSGENPAFPEAGLLASASAHVALGPRPHPQQPVSTCLAGPGSRGPRSSRLPGPGTQLALLHKCGRPGGPQANRPPREAWPLPAQPPLASLAQPPASPAPAPDSPGLSGQKPQRKCLFVPVMPKAKQFVVCDPHFLPFFSEHNKAQDSSPTPTPQADRNDLFTLALALGRALRDGRPRRRGAGPGRGGGLLRLG